MEQRRSRRRVLRQAAGAILGAALLLRGHRAAGAPALEVCFWRREHWVCDNGRARELWCYHCCVGTSCVTEWCEWRVVGSC